MAIVIVDFQSSNILLTDATNDHNSIIETNVSVGAGYVYSTASF